MDNAAVSVIIPTYNRALLLGRAISSALPQLEDTDELIVVDDGSTDETEDLVKQFSNKVRYVRTSHRGAGAARNRGIKEAVNPLIAFLDSDDIWMPNKIKIQRGFLQARPDVLFCFSDFAIRKPDGMEYRFALQTWTHDTRSWSEILSPGESVSTLGILPQGEKDFNYYVGDLYQAEMSANYVSIITLMVRRVEAGASLHLAEDLPTYEDWECFGRISKAGKGTYLACETAWLLGHQGSRLTDADALKCATARIKILKRIWGADKDFLRRYAHLYRSVLDRQRMIRVSGLIARARTKEARCELRELSSAPFIYHILVRLPGVLIKGLLRVKRFIIRKRQSNRDSN